MTINWGEQVEQSMKPSVYTNLKRIEAIEARMQSVEMTVATIKDDTGEIRAILTGAKGVVGFCQRHAPRFIYMIAGLAVGAGWISAETGRSIGALLGF